jgi:hypothetical protein
MRVFAIFNFEIFKNLILNLVCFVFFFISKKKNLSNSKVNCTNKELNLVLI